MIEYIHHCVSQLRVALNLFSQTSDAVLIKIDKTGPKTNELKQALSINTLFSTYERKKVH